MLHFFFRHRQKNSTQHKKKTPSSNNAARQKSRVAATSLAAAICQKTAILTKCCAATELLVRYASGYLVLDATRIHYLIPGILNNNRDRMTGRADGFMFNVNNTHISYRTSVGYRI